jgi:hypothetical protein
MSITLPMVDGAGVLIFVGISANSEPTIAAIPIAAPAAAPSSLVNGILPGTIEDLRAFVSPVAVRYGGRDQAR